MGRTLDIALETVSLFWTPPPAKKKKNLVGVPWENVAGYTQRRRAVCWAEPGLARYGTKEAGGTEAGGPPTVMCSA